MALVTIVTVQPQATEATLSLKYVASSIQHELKSRQQPDYVLPGNP